MDVFGPDPIEKTTNITLWVAIAILVITGTILIILWRTGKLKKS